MNSSLSFKILVVVLSALALTSLAQAQATRTWVSGVGDDANPCSRTAPCKTFAGAISKTAAGGEISVLDPGGFGAVTITKSITLNGEATLGSVLVVGTNGIVVAAGASDVVKLIHLKILGTFAAGNQGINGIRYLSGKQLMIEDSKIYGFSTNCIDVSTSTAAQVEITNTTLQQCGSNAGVNLVNSSGGGGIKADLNEVVITGGVNGVIVGNGVHATIRNSDINEQSAVGVQVGDVASPPNGAAAFIDTCNVSTSGTGVRGNGATTFSFLANNTIAGNGLGVNSNGGTLNTFSDNKFADNTSDGLFTGSIMKK
jgi:hypothetical protein